MQLPDNSAARVLVVGDVMLDVYIRATVDRISQEAPVPVAKVVGEDYSRPGGAANVAVNVRAMGARTVLMGACGYDHWSVLLAKLVGQSGVEALLLQASDLPTTTKTRVMAGRDYQAQVLRIDNEGVPGPEQRAALLESAIAAVQSDDVRATCVVLSDYAKGAIPDPQPIIREAQRKRIPVLVDPKRADWSLYSGASIIKPNLAEFLAAMGVRRLEDIEYPEVREALKAMRIGAAVVTLGSAGAIIVDPESEVVLKVPVAGNAGAVVDVTGAGDTVMAAMAAWSGTGLDHAGLVAIGMRAAAISVSRVGTTTVTRQELADA